MTMINKNYQIWGWTMKVEIPNIKKTFACQAEFRNFHGLREHKTYHFDTIQQLAEFVQRVDMKPIAGSKPVMLTQAHSVKVFTDVTAAVDDLGYQITRRD